MKRAHPAACPPRHDVAIPLIYALLISLALASPAQAGDKKNKDREMLRRAQMQLQQAESERATLAAEKDQLSQDLAVLQKEAGAAKKKLKSASAQLTQEKAKNQALGKDLAALQQEAAGLKEKLAQTETSLADTHRKLAETSTNLARTEGDRKRLEGIKGRQEKEIASCESHNQKLYQAGRDILGQWQKTAVGQSDPVLGLKRVEIENLGESFRDRLDTEKLVKAPER